MKSKIRDLKVSVISDVHLATHACKAKPLLKYLKSINPEILVLNGDIIDSWRFSRNYFPKPHLKVVRQFIKMLEKGVKIFYITGNHDEFLRKFNGAEMGNLKIVNQLILDLDDHKTWIFHGDLFDHVIHQAKWLAKFGAAIYGLLTVANKSVNAMLRLFKLKDVIIYKSIKKKLIKDKTQLTHFEEVITKISGERNYKTVICGHTHIPRDKSTLTANRLVRYINCGDWVEHFTAAEYHHKKWHLFHYIDNQEDDENNDEPDIPNKKEVYKSLFQELAVANLL
ncbi:UDP-2,3-diacylglucosamine diphosphatase [Sunxiuqinia indica]|uniref:UDP-2,3-diacylglucosamine diphosphatase n=1 Tax=Sunxiuqinia indica TaxID=2692584 RepID=UPI0013580961|nr:UDP-2,3-diacylglucosamine diphosphatase [Sunxiuqinia indica]